MDWTAVIPALVSVTLGWTLSLLAQKRQHRLDMDRFNREQEALDRAALRRRGEEIADEIIACLLSLRDLVPRTVYWHRQETDADAKASAEQELRRLTLLSLRHPDEQVRFAVELAREVLQWPDEIVYWGGEGFGSPREVVWRTCQETLEVVGRYVRGESGVSHSDGFQQLERAQKLTIREKQAQWEAQEESMCEDERE